MRKYILVPVIALMLLASENIFARGAEKPGTSSWPRPENQYKGDFHCYKAWRKDIKIQEIEIKADELEYYRPKAAARKMRAVYRRASRRDTLEQQHRSGYYVHDWWWGWTAGWAHDFWY